MAAVTEIARAKLNLTLDVLGKREDGYHDIVSVMQTVELGDRVTIEETMDGGIVLSTNRDFLPTDRRNTAYKAAQVFFEATGFRNTGVSIRIEKEIPVCAGLGGGSADAAAVLRGLCRLLGVRIDRELMEKMALEVGSDVPFCLTGGTAVATGRGEVLTSIKPLQGCQTVICKPEYGVSTPELFARIDDRRITARPDHKGMLAAIEQGDITELSRRLFNVFEEVAERKSFLSEIKNVLLDKGALGAVMSGTGPTVFGLFTSPKAAREAYKALKPLHRDTFLTKTV